MPRAESPRLSRAGRLLARRRRRACPLTTARRLRVRWTSRWLEEGCRASPSREIPADVFTVKRKRVTTPFSSSRLEPFSQAVVRPAPVQFIRSAPSFAFRPAARRFSYRMLRRLGLGSLVQRAAPPSIRFRFPRRTLCCLRLSASPPDASGRTIYMNGCQATRVGHVSPNIRSLLVPLVRIRVFSYFLSFPYRIVPPSTAPSGTCPNSTNRHNATNNLRARATMPIRFKRLPCPSKRSRNHRLNALFG